MSCRHEAKVETTRFKGITIYRIVCSKCGRRTIWAEYQRLAEKFSKTARTGCYQREAKNNDAFTKKEPRNNHPESSERGFAHGWLVCHPPPAGLRLSSWLV